MKINKINALYFSPTRSSEKICCSVANCIAGTSIPIEEYSFTFDNKGKNNFNENELLIISAPVYGGRLPDLAIERFDTLKGHNTPVVVIACYGNRGYDDALLEFKDFLNKRGFVTIAAACFIGEHSYSREKENMPIALNRPDSSDIVKTEDFGRKVFSKLSKIDNVEKLNELRVKGNFPYKVKKPSTPSSPVCNHDLCTLCGTCVDLCPAHAISIVNDLITFDPTVCIKCCSCVKNCPTEALIFDTPYTKYIFENFSKRLEPEFFI